MYLKITNPSSGFESKLKLLLSNCFMIVQANQEVTHGYVCSHPEIEWPLFFRIFLPLAF